MKRNFCATNGSSAIFPSTEKVLHFSRCQNTHKKSSFPPHLVVVVAVVSEVFDKFIAARRAAPTRRLTRFKFNHNDWLATWECRDRWWRSKFSSDVHNFKIVRVCVCLYRELVFIGPRQKWWKGGAKVCICHTNEANELVEFLICHWLTTGIDKKWRIMANRHWTVKNC